MSAVDCSPILPGNAPQKAADTRGGHVLLILGSEILTKQKTELPQKRFLDRIVLKFPESIVLNCYWTAIALSSKSETCGAHLRKLEERLKFNSFGNTKGVLALGFPLGLGTWVSPSPSSREWSEFLKGISLQTQ